MHTNNSEQIHRSIKRFRIMAITFAGLIAILTAVMIFRITATLDTASATKINMAGEQRVLAQRIVTSALSIDVAIRTDNWKALESILTQLQQSSSSLQSTHAVLYHGDSNLKITATHSPARLDAFQALEHPLRSLISSSTELQSLTISMIRRSPYIDQQTIDRVSAAKNEIIQSHAIFSPQMNNIVDLYEQDYKATIASSIRGAKFGMAILIGVLVAILLFVIEPTFLIVRKQIAQLGKAINQAQRADAIRWRLLTNIGHEFRTPMNAIMGFADLLSDDSLTDSERSRLVKSIYESSTQLTTLIGTMLDMSAIESGQLRITKERCDLTQILTEIKVDATTKSLSKQLEINLTIEDSCPGFITTDAKRFEQILSKLTDNAIKFTPSGSIDINAKILNNTAHPLLQITITDTGIGINEEDLASIFDPFQQAEDTLTRNYGGAGLGLSISRDIAKALGGNVTVTSTPNKGSSFTITIDPGKAQAQTQAKTSSHSTSPTETHGVLADYKILVVDDAKDNRILLQHILKKTGATLEFAMDGQQAIDAIVNVLDDNSPFDLILMDMQMPVMDGYFATVKLREQGINVPIIAVTAHALEGDREHCINSGCNEYLTKPINKSLLIETCLKLIKEHADKAEPSRKAA